MARTKVIKETKVKFAMNIIGKSKRNKHSMDFAIECVVSIAIRAENGFKFTADLLTLFISSQWGMAALIFDIIKFSKSLYRFLIKFLKIVSYSSIVFSLDWRVLWF